MNTNLAFDLFLLMFNLTQLHNKDKIIELFIEGMQEIFKPVVFNYSLSAEPSSDIIYEIRTRKSQFGVIVTAGPLPSEKELCVLIANSIQMLAVTLEHLDYEHTLENERNKYEEKALKSLDELKSTVRDLQDSRTASINLIEDLSDEVEKRKETERELLLKNLVFDESIAANSISDINGVLKQANASFLKTWDYMSEEEVVGRPISDFFKYENEVTEIIKSLDETGQWNGEYTALKKDGSTFPASGLATVIRNKNGELIGYQSSVQDISDRKRTEEALRENEERFRHVFEDGQFSMVLVDRNFRFLHVNEAFCRMIGYSEDEMQSFTLKDITHSDHLAQDVENVNKLYAGSIEVYLTEKRYIRKDKGIVWGSVNISPMRDKLGNFRYFLAMIDDITERKLAEDLLRQNETLLQNIIDKSNSLIYMVDTEGRFLMVNEPLLTLLTATPARLIGKTRDGFLPKEIADIHRINDLEVLNTGKTQIFEEENTEPDGKHFYLTTKFPLFNSQQEIYAIGGLSTDITERKNADLALRESEERFRSLYENVTIGIYRTTSDGQILMANPALVKMLGFDSFEQLKARNLTVEGYEPDYPRSKFLETIGKSGKIQGMESAWRQKNGNVLNIRESANAVQDANGRMLYIDGTVEDISDRKKTEEALRESEDKFKYIFDNSVIGKSVTLPTGEINVNMAFCDMLGYRQEELEKTRWQDISHTDDIEVTQNIVNSLLSGEKESARFIKRYIHKNESIVWTEVGTTLRKDDKGRPLYFLTTINDITERKRVEDELRLQSEIMSHIAEAVYLVRMEDRIIVFTNSKFEELFGYEPGEMIGKHVSIVNAPTEKSPEETATEIMDGLDENGNWKGEVKNIRKDGTLFWTSASVTIFDHSHFGKVLVAVQRDITYRKIAESRIKQLNEELELRVNQRTEQLQSANKELEAFSYSVSHDLRAPLRAIHSFTSILRQDYEKILDEEGNRICKIIETSSIHMGQLIDDLLAFSRVGRTGLDHNKINMVQLANAVYSELTITLEQKRITFIVERLPPASGDAVMIKQVFTNLISNAIKYSSKKETARIVIGSESSDNEVIYYVKDDGVGFDMQYSNKLFGVFQRLHSAKEFEGNGVGLAIVQRIIHRHDGRVWAEGEKGMGATFYFALPVKPEQSN